GARTAGQLGSLDRNRPSRSEDEEPLAVSGRAAHDDQISGASFGEFQHYRHSRALRVAGWSGNRVVPPDVVRREIVRRAGGDDRDVLRRREVSIQRMRDADRGSGVVHHVAEEVPVRESLDGHGVRQVGIANETDADRISLNASFSAASYSGASRKSEATVEVWNDLRLR